MIPGNALIDDAGNMTDDVTARADPVRVVRGIPFLLDDADHRIGIPLAVWTLDIQDAHVAADTRGAAGLVVNFGAFRNSAHAGVDPVGSRQHHEALDLAGTDDILLPERVQKAAVVVQGCLVAVGLPARRYVFDQMDLLEYCRVLLFKYPLNSLGSSHFAGHPVGGGIVRMLDHLLHVSAAFPVVAEFALLDFVEERRRDERLNKTGRLELLILVDGDQFFASGEIVH